MSKINIIVAFTDNLVIGKGNDLPWNLPSDLKYFKKTTAGKTVIMGKLCWLSIPEKFRPLPGRTNIVLSRDESFEAKGATVSNDLAGLLEQFKSDGKSDEVFVIGGAQIYKEAFKCADKLYITKIHATVEGDVFLEGFNESDWEWQSESATIEENGFKYRFLTYTKPILSPEKSETKIMERDEYDVFMEEYDTLHECCPKRGSIAHSSTLMGYVLNMDKKDEYKDLNKCECTDCGDIHTAHERVAKK